MKTYMFTWNGGNKYIEAETDEKANELFMERFGFFPDFVQITILKD